MILKGDIMNKSQDICRTRSQGSFQTTNLDRVGREIGLADIISKAPSLDHVVSPTTMSATMEAILGAVWDDSTGDLSAIRLVAQNLGLWPEA